MIQQLSLAYQQEQKEKESLKTQLTKLTENEKYLQNKENEWTIIVHSLKKELESSHFTTKKLTKQVEYL